MFTLAYSHCTRYTFGQPDRAPHSEYVWRSVQAQMYRHPADYRLGETEDTFSVQVDGEMVGWGDTKEEAVGEAKYRLMDRSRKAMEEASRVAGGR